jgi:hypothetical protein
LKWQAEKVVQQFTNHYSILRATQFHELVDHYFSVADKYSLPSDS